MDRVQQAELPAFAEFYLKELEFVLRGSDEQENVLHDVRGHLIETLLTAPQDQQQAAVREALAVLGTVEQIASTSNGAVRDSVKERPSNFADALAIVVAVVAVPVALIVPVYGALFALLVFVSSVLGVSRTRPVTSRTLGRFWAPVVVSGCALLIGLAVLTLQLPFGQATSVEVDIPVFPS